MMKYSSAALVIETKNSIYVLHIGGSWHQLYCLKGTFEGKEWQLASLAPYLDEWNAATEDRMATANCGAIRLEGKPLTFTLYKSQENDPSALNITTVKKAYWTLTAPDLIDV